jgi:histidinol dehydrogenase
MPNSVTNKVHSLLQDVQGRGDRAVAEALKRYDGVDLPPSRWRVPSRRMAEAWRSLPADRRAILREAASHIERFHREEKRRLVFQWRKTWNGLTLGQQVRPVDSAGLYVPGGRFAYPSTVLMTAIPARVAGVPRRVVVTPPRHLSDEILAACHVAGVTELFQVGGPAAVAALAYGTKTIPKVDMVAGPGGVWVTEAKRQVTGTVGIDSLAGPSEIVVVADRSAPPDWVAADLMAQAEHDPSARATVISTEKAILTAVKSRVSPAARRQCEFLYARDMETALAQANAVAPEHLSLMVRRPERWLGRVRHAGAVFLGPSSPVAAGDYWAGPSHVLPTAGTARFSSGLSVQTFLKRTSVIGVTPALMARRADAVARFAEAEGLLRHAASLRARKGK